MKFLWRTLSVLFLIVAIIPVFIAVLLIMLRKVVYLVYTIIKLIEGFILDSIKHTCVLLLSKLNDKSLEEVEKELDFLKK